MKKMLKFIVIQLLVLVMPFTVFMNHVHAEDVGQWSSNYKLWSQGASKWSGVREVGCWIVAMSEMIYESGVVTSPEFNPDVFAEWEVANGELLNLTTNLYQQHLHGEGRAPVLYAEQKGVVLGYLGKMENPITDEQLWANINAGIFTIIFVTNSHTSNHYVLVDNDYSLATNELYVYESMPGAVECGSVPLSNYNRGQSYSYKREDTEQPVISDLLETNFTDNGLQIRFTAEDNWKVTKYGAVVQTAGKDLINDGVDVPGEYDYEKGDIKVDIDLTQLGLGTDVKLVNIKWYAEDKAGNKVYKINQKAHNLYAAVKDESIEGTYEAVADVKIRRAPYENIEGWDTWIGTLKRGEKVSVSGVYHNHYDHDWYKIDDEKWIYSENLRKASNHSVFEDIIKFIKNGLEFFWVGRFPVVKTVTTEVSAREYFSGNAVPEQGSYAIVEGTPYAQTINPDGSVTNVEYQYCTVNFDLNGAVGYESSKTIMTGSRYGELPASARFGYGLVGWFTEPEGGTQITSDTICDITGNITLYAHWEKRKVLEGKCGDNITYTLGGDGVLHLSGYGEMKTHPWTETHKDIVLEVTTEGEITTICEDAFADCVWLQSVEFPSTLKSIEKNAFKGDYNLKIDTLRLPEGLASIGAYAFNGCKGIGGLELPTTLTSVDQAAFSGCSGLSGALDLSHITYFGNYAFAYCTGITEITIPVELRYYRSNASGSGGTSIFEGTKDVEKIHYVKQADGIMIDRQSSYTDAVGYYKYTLEYQSNGSLKEIVFDEGITRIGNYAYYHIATGEYGFLEKITLPSTLTSIGDYAFAYQKGSNVSIEFPDGLNSIGKSAFAGFTGLTAKDLYLPSSLKTVADGAFSGCSGLTGALDLSHITYFGNYAFAYCTGITEVTIPVELNYYRNNASGSGGISIFAGTTNVEKIHYTKQSDGKMLDRQSSYTDAVGYYKYTLEYQSHGSLKEITFDEGITRIGNYAYYYASTGEYGFLQKITLPSTLTSIGDYAFAYQKGTDVSIEFPDGLNSIGKAAFAGFTGLKVKDLYLPSSLTTVGDSAFSGCSGLSGALDLSHITYFGNYAFANCTGITEVTIPVELNYYRNNASGSGGISIFEGTSNVEKIHYTTQSSGVMPDRQSSSYTSSSYMEYTLEYQSRNSLKDIVFDEGITRIGNNAFSNNTVLVNALLPKSLTSVGTNNFTKINKSNAVFYGYKDTYGESYSNSLNVKFIPLYYPLFSDDNPGKVFRGRTVRLDGRVYTGIGIYNDNVEWSLSGQSSEETVLDENGNLYVSMDETSEEITVTIKYGEYSSELNLPVSTAKEVEVTSASIALKDKIGVNFYLYMNEDDVDDLTVNLKFNGEVINIPASEGVKKTYSGRKVRVFTVDTVARQMRDQIVLTVTDSDGYTATLTRDDQDYTDTGYPYRVVDYFAAAQEAGVTGKLGDLLDKMDNYGKYAQIQFKHNVTDEVRNTKPVDDVTLEDLDDYAARAGGEVEGIAYTSGSLELNSAISFRTYFELQEGYDISSYTFTVDGNTVTPTLKASSNSYYVSVLGIPARALGDEHTITVSDGTDTITVKYCALSYAYSVVSSDAAPDTLKNLCKAIYLYGDAAKTYFTN